jgi:hypothetical protein
MIAGWGVRIRAWPHRHQRVCDRIVKHLREVRRREGLGKHRTPRDYGAAGGVTHFDLGGFRQRLREGSGRDAYCTLPYMASISAI